MTKEKGGMLMAWVSGATVAFATTHTLRINGTTADVSNKDEGGGDWASNEVNLLDWSIDSSNFYSYDGEGMNYDDLFDIMVSKIPVDIKFTRRTMPETKTVPVGGWVADTTIPWYSGKAVITNLELTADNGDYSRYNVTFTGVGELKKTSGNSNYSGNQGSQGGNSQGGSTNPSGGDDSGDKPFDDGN